MTKQNTIAPQSCLIEDGAGDTLHRVRAVLSLLMSVNWDSPMPGAAQGQQAIFDDILSALTHVIAQLDSAEKGDAS